MFGGDQKIATGQGTKERGMEGHGRSELRERTYAGFVAKRGISRSSVTSGWRGTKGSFSLRISLSHRWQETMHKIWLVS